MIFPSPFIMNPGERKEEMSSSSKVRALAIEVAKLDFAEFAQRKHRCSFGIYYPAELRTCTHIWVRVDRVRRPLEAPYSGRSLVVKRGEHFLSSKTIRGRASNTRRLPKGSSPNPD